MSIKVLDVYALRPAAFDTAMDAIRIAQSNNDARQTSELASCYQKRITNAFCTHDGFVLIIDNSYEMRFCSTADHSVDVTVHDVCRDALLLEPEGSKELVLRFSTTHEIVWKRQELLDDLVGRILHKLYFSGQLTFLYPSEGQVLQVNVLVETQLGRRFLYWEHVN